ncbi:MAG: right-handed parallel beta-helix repeat-containing protein, partial [Planctomycetes bacterium]|nr:right-handed parallel beta-helix repeat-containing protein [Planctomycetota bacterium]
MIGSSTLSALLVGALACACGALFCSEEASAGAAWYVDDVNDPAEDGSAAHPFDAIQEGIDAAVNGDTVIVLDGTYSGAGNRDLSFAGKVITLTSSNGPEACIIDCEAAAGLVFGAGEGFDAVVEGFTITRGNPGIVCFFSSTPTIANNIIIDNTAVGESGAGISCFSASPIITGNVITGNEAGLFGGGIYCRSVSSPTITNNVIADNEAADKGGGIAIHWTSSPPMANNTITGNRASVGGGIYVVDLSAPSLINSIVWGNSAAQGAQIALAAGSRHGSSLSVSYCDVEGGQADAAAPIGSTLVWGPGNIDLDPLFADADGGDYHLKSRYGRWDSYANTGAGAWAFDGVASPCIDAGDP